MKKIQYIQYIFMAIAIVLPVGASAATFSLVPKIDTIAQGKTMVSSVYVNPGAGETITATKVSILFPSATVKVLSYTPVSGGNILAHIGTKTDNTTGTITDNVAFNPGVTASIKIATIVFEAKKVGSASITFGAGSQLLNSTNTNKNVSTASANAKLTVKAPVATPKIKAKAKAKAQAKNPVLKKVTPKYTPKAVVQTAAAKAKTAAKVASTTATTTNNQFAAVAVAQSTKGKGGSTIYLIGALGVIVGFVVWWFTRKRFSKHL